MLYLGRETGMNMEEEYPVLLVTTYFTLKFAFRAVSKPGSFEEL